MKISQFISNIDGVINGITDIVIDACDVAALDAKAMLQSRIQEEGLNSSGASFEPYSKNKLPLFFFAKNSKVNVLNTLGIDNTGKLVNKGRKGIKNPYSEGVSYEEWRKLMGLPITHVTLTVTGEMWKKIGLLGSNVDGGNIITRIGGRDPSTRQKMSWIAERRGDFMGLTNDEAEDVTGVMHQEVISRIIERLEQ